jgi:hypothetical protein
MSLNNLSIPTGRAGSVDRGAGSGEGNREHLPPVGSGHPPILALGEGGAVDGGGGATLHRMMSPPDWCVLRTRNAGYRTIGVGATGAPSPLRIPFAFRYQVSWRQNQDSSSWR